MFYVVRIYFRKVTNSTKMFSLNYIPIVCLNLCMWIDIILPYLGRQQVTRKKPQYVSTACGDYSQYS